MHDSLKFRGCRRALFLMPLLFLAAPASSAGQPPESGLVPETVQEPEQEIVVVGLKDPFTLRANQLRDMLNAFYGKRTGLAPSAKLFVELKDLGDGLLADTRFVLHRKTGDLLLPKDEADRIYFPDQSPVSADLSMTSNISKKQVGIALWVMSPTTTVARRTMGDLRLQCEVMWAAAKSTASPVVRALFGSAGACKSSKIAFYFRSSRALGSGHVVVAGREIPLQVGRNQLAYRAPIWDKKIPNEAPVFLNFR